MEAILRLGEHVSGEQTDLVSYRLVRSSTVDELSDALRQMIMAGVLRPGEALRQERLAAELGVSRTPLREALHRLAAQSLVELDHKRGAIVTRVTREDLQELYELREIVETAAIVQVAARFTDEHYEDLRDLAIPAPEADEREWVRGNRTFHNALYAISGKTQLVELIDTLGARADVYVALLARSRSSRDVAANDHVDLLDALRDRDPTRAVAIVRRHLANAIATVGTAIQDQV